MKLLLPALILVGLVLQIVLCAEGPLAREGFPIFSPLEWLVTAAFATPMAMVGMGGGIALKLIPVMRERWLWPLTAGAWFGVGLSVVGFIVGQ